MQIALSIPAPCSQPPLLRPARVAAFPGQNQLPCLNGSQYVAAGADAHGADPEDLALELLLTSGDNYALLLHATAQPVSRDTLRHLHGGYCVGVAGIRVHHGKELYSNCCRCRANGLLARFWYQSLLRQYLSNPLVNYHGDFIFAPNVVKLFFIS